MDRHTQLALIQAVFDCSQQSALALCDLVRWNRVERSGAVLHQGFTHTQCHFVVSGTADLKLISANGHDFQIATVEVGEMFGCYPTPEELSSDVHARGELEYISIDTHRLVEAVRNDSELGMGLSKILAQQLRVVQDRYAARLTLTANGRVYEQLLKMCDENFVISPSPVIAALAVKAQTTRETASRAVSSAVRRGIVAKHENALEIAAPHQLEGMVF